MSVAESCTNCEALRHQLDEAQALISERKSIKKMRVLHERVEAAEKDRDRIAREVVALRTELETLRSLYAKLSQDAGSLNEEVQRLNPIAESGERLKAALRRALKELAP